MQDMMSGMRGQMGGATGQTAKTDKSAEPTLESMLQQAIKDNPDIRVAEAKVRESEAELNRTRLQVTQKVLAFYHSRESQKAIIKVAEEDLQRIQKLEASKAVSQEDVKQAQQQLGASKAKLAEIEAEMPYLLGQQQNKVLSVAFSPDGKSYSTLTDGTVRLWDAASGKQLSEPYSASKLLSQVHPEIIGTPNYNVEITNLQPFVSFMRGTSQESGTIADRVRKALDTRQRFDYHQKKVSEILAELNRKVPGLSIHDLTDVGDDPIDLSLDGEVPVRTALALLEDTCNILRMNNQPLNPKGAPNRLGFVLRDYGLLFARIDQLPPGVIHLSNIGSSIQASPTEKGKAPANEEKNQPGAEKKN
jgi:hypothetical protein